MKGVIISNQYIESVIEELKDLLIKYSNLNGEKIEESVSMKSMQKQLRAMKKELKASKESIQKQVQTEAEDRLRKMGFKEETGLQSPQLVTGAQTFGVEGTTPLAKATGDVAGQLAELSYTELRRMQEQIASGNTDGLPKELIN